MYNYSCKECGNSVTKKPTGNHAGAYSGLGGWRCGKCGSGIKVTRTLKKED